jgi:hypothetical protein
MDWQDQGQAMTSGGKRSGAGRPRQLAARVTVSIVLDRRDLAILDRIGTALGTPSRSAAIRHCIRHQPIRRARTGSA